VIVLVVAIATGTLRARAVVLSREAPTGFDNVTNGYITQAEFDTFRRRFEEPEAIADGLGPMYNAESCSACHASPITGGASQVTELRAGHLDAEGRFVEPVGGALIHERAIAPDIQAHVSDDQDVRGFRASPSVLRLGYVEAIDDATLLEVARQQATETGGRIAGQIAMVPVLEAAGTLRVGRFGWKNQHASLLSFVADAYVNELGITNRLAPAELPSLSALLPYDAVPDPEDSPERPIGEQDIDVLTAFVRATKAPAPDRALAGTADARIGVQIFRAIGCAVCHVESLVTAPAGTVVNGGALVVPAALGDNVIHPFSDFLLHDVGTGDGIPQGSAPGAMFRTAPLWGLRTRTRLMHDGASLTPMDAVRRHRGEALSASMAASRIGQREWRRLLVFLQSL